MKGVRLATAAVVWIVLAVTPAWAWEPDRFEVYCGQPARESAWIRANYAAGLEEDPNTRMYYAEHYGEDADVTQDPGCLSQGRKDLVEDYAQRSLQALKGMGFASPSPIRLGPVVSGMGDQPVVRLFVDRGLSGVANVISPCTRSGGIIPDQLSLMTLSVSYFEGWPPPVTLRLIAHEMTHVVQNAQPFQTEPNTDNCAGIPDWLIEGTADAVSVHIAKQRFPGYKPPLTVRGAKSFYGLRPYNKAFTWESRTATDDSGFKIIPEYRSSSFFMHLADHYFQRKYGYLASFFAVPDLNSGGDDWLYWLDTLLRNSDPGPKIPLYLVFPDFMANYAQWGSTKYKHIGEEDWLAESFDGCHELAVSSSQPTGTLTIELEPISAQCIKVTADVMPGQLAQVKMMAYADSKGEVDNLHLGVSAMSGKIVEFGGRDMNCWEVAKQNRGKPACITKPFTGQKGAGRDGGVATQGSSGEWVKTWLSTTQEGTGGPLVNRYVLVHTPVKPRDARHDNRNIQEVRLVVGLALPKLKTTSHGEATKASSSINGNKAEPIPMKGGGGSMDALAAAAGGDPEALSKLPFLMNTSASSTLDMSAVIGDGISSVALSKVEVKSDGYGSGRLEPNLQMTLLLDKKAIPFGASGSFPAWVSGSDLKETEKVGEMTAAEMNASPMAAVMALAAPAMLNLYQDRPSGTIEVVEFSEELLHLRVQANYCLGNDWDIESESCRQPQSFSGEVIEPFGWAYDTATPFTSVDTPGMEVYRKHLYREMQARMGFALPPMPGDDSSGSGDSGGSGGSGDSGGPQDGPPASDSDSGTACDCSCGAFERLKEMEKDEVDQPSAEMMRMTQCAMQCISQWMACQ